MRGQDASLERYFERLQRVRRVPKNLSVRSRPHDDTDQRLGCGVSTRLGSLHEVLPVVSRGGVIGTFPAWRLQLTQRIIRTRLREVNVAY